MAAVAPWSRRLARPGLTAAGAPLLSPVTGLHAAAAVGAKLPARRRVWSPLGHQLPPPCWVFFFAASAAFCFAAESAAAFCFAAASAAAFCFAASAAAFSAAFC